MTRHLITPSEADDAAHLFFAVCEELAQERGLCPGCLITQAIFRACYWAARQQAMDEDDLTRLAQLIGAALLEGFKDGRGAEQDEGAALDFDPDPALLAYRAETRH